MEIKKNQNGNALTLSLVDRLDTGTASVKDLAYLCGFSDPLYFSAVFKKYTGASPSHYIRRGKK